MKQETGKGTQTEQGTEAAGRGMQLLTLKEAAAILGVGPKSITAFMKSGHLPYVAIGTRQKRVSLAALREFIAKGGMKGGNSK